MSSSSPRSASPPDHDPRRRACRPLGGRAAGQPADLPDRRLPDRRRQWNSDDLPVGHQVPQDDRIAARRGPERATRARHVPRSRMWRVRVERSGRDRRGRATQEVSAQSLAPADRRRRRPRHRRGDRVPAVPEGGARRSTVPSRPASSRAPSSSRPRTPSSTSIRRTRRPPAAWSRSTRAISSTILTMWLVMAIVIIGSVLMIRGSKLVPGRGQNVFEFVYEFLSDFGMGIAGPEGAPLHPDLPGRVPARPVRQLDRPGAAGRQDRGAAGAVERRQHHDRDGPRQLLRSSTVEGFRHLGVRGYLGKFFPCGRVPEGHRRRGHRHVRRPDRAHARVRQAGHAVDATLRQHLRRRGGPRRHHRR